METRHFEKIEEWFVQLNRDVKDIRSSIETLATKDMVENRFNMLAASMKALLDRIMRLDERLGSHDAEVVTLKLAVKRLEDEIEQMRQSSH